MNAGCEACRNCTFCEEHGWNFDYEGMTDEDVMGRPADKTIRIEGVGVFKIWGHPLNIMEPVS